MIFIILSFIYAIVVLSFCFGILFLKQGKNNNLNKFSIIIAARNEEKNLPQLLENLVDQNYPQDHYEIIVADDRSTDRTSLIVKEYIQKFPNLKLIRIKEETENLVGEVLNTAEKEDYDINITEKIIDLQNSLDIDEKEILIKYSDEIKPLIEKEIVKRYYYEDGVYKYNSNKDEYLKSSIMLLNNKKKYQNILTGSHTKMN